MDLTFGNTWPYEAHYFATSEGRLHYIDEGPKDAQPIVLVHGNPTWGYLYRDFIPILLKAGLRVITVDHLGFGLSDKMNDLSENQIHRHGARFSQFMQSLQLDDIILVIHDWGGPIAMDWAVDAADKVQRLVILDTILFAQPQAKKFWPFVFFMKLPLISNLFIQGLNLFVKGILFRLGVYDPAHYSNHNKQAYLYPFPTWKSRGPILNFARQIPLSQKSAVMPLLRKIEQGLPKFKDKPVDIFWAKPDVGFKCYLQPTIAAFPQANVTLYDKASHFLQEDVGSDIASKLVELIASNKA